MTRRRQRGKGAQRAAHTEFPEIHVQPVRYAIFKIPHADIEIRRHVVRRMVVIGHMRRNRPQMCQRGDIRLCRRWLPPHQDNEGVDGPFFRGAIEQDRFDGGLPRASGGDDRAGMRHGKQRTRRKGDDTLTPGWV